MAKPPAELKPEKDLPVATLNFSSYQPGLKELREDLRGEASFDEALGALVKPVKVKTERR
ncbi:MAG: hypothetical protein OXG94_03505 [Bacteroidetes bacterium]|nr:hypothetical protein [Bacteroidota bacterium]